MYADGSSLLEQFEELEDIFENTNSTDSGQTALKKVFKFDANVDVAVKGVKDSLLETLSHLDKMETVMEDFQSAVEDLHGHVVTSPSIPRVSEHDWKVNSSLTPLCGRLKRKGHRRRNKSVSSPPFPQVQQRRVHLRRVRDDRNRRESMTLGSN